MAVIESLKSTQELGFGLYFCPWIVKSRFQKGEWEAPKLSALENLNLDAAAKVLHYGQEIFEGLKVFKQTTGKFSFFRPTDNIIRMKRSAEILAMPAFPEAEFTESLKLISNKCHELIPDEPGSLYLRPTMIGTSATLGVAPSS